MRGEGVAVHRGAVGVWVCGVGIRGRARGLLADMARQPLEERLGQVAEVAFLERVTELIESTGKPIINVPLRPLEAATFPGGARHDPVMLYSPVAAVRALAAMAWYGEYVAAQARL